LRGAAEEIFRNPGDIESLPNFKGQIFFENKIAFRENCFYKNANQLTV